MANLWIAWADSGSDIDSGCLCAAVLSDPWDLPSSPQCQTSQSPQTYMWSSVTAFWLRISWRTSSRRSQPETIGAAHLDGAPLPKGPGEQWLLRMLIPQQAAQEVSHNSKAGARADSCATHNCKLALDMVAAVAAVSPQAPQGQDNTVAGVGPGASSGRQAVWRWRPVTWSKMVLHEEEVQMQWRQWQGPSSDAHCLSHGVGQDGFRPLLCPLRLWCQRKVKSGARLPAASSEIWDFTS